MSTFSSNICGLIKCLFFISFAFLKECVDGFYNEACTAKCGHCKDNITCNKESGHCPQNCTGNFKPPFCQGTVNITILWYYFRKYFLCISILIRFFWMFEIYK